MLSSSIHSFSISLGYLPVGLLCEIFLFHCNILQFALLVSLLISIGLVTDRVTVLVTFKEEQTKSFFVLVRDRF